MKSRIVSITMAAVAACFIASAGSAGNLPEAVLFPDSTVGSLHAQTGPSFETFVGNAGTTHHVGFGFAQDEPISDAFRMEITKPSPDFMAGTKSAEHNGAVGAMPGFDGSVPGSALAKASFGHDLENVWKSECQAGGPWSSSGEPVRATWAQSWADVHRSGMIGGAGTPGRDVLPEEDLTTPQNVTLEDNYWSLVELNGESIHTGKDQRVPQMQFSAEENQVSGFAGCNQFFGGVSLEGNELAFGPMGMTRMYCPPCDGGDLEQAFVTALASATSYTINGSTLELYSGEELVARFELAPSPM